VLPPGVQLTLLNGIFLLQSLNEAPGKTIDAFFESLAADQQERAVGVILSGMGDDGTQGLSAIKAHGGLVLVQDPVSAEFPSMPQHAVASGMVDQVLFPDQLAALLYGRATDDHLLDEGDLASSNSQLHLQKILLLIRSQLGHDFTQYKPSTLIRRIDRRMKSHHIKSLPEYLHFLQGKPDEVQALFHDLTINVTSFFRDPDAFAQLKVQLRLAFSAEESREAVRAWVAGCASGEEAYSVAILLHELNEEFGGRFSLQIFATDIDPHSITTARLGLYPHGINQMVSAARLERYFTRTADGYQISTQVRESVIFALHNTFNDPPFTRMDLVCCRNMLIYLKAELQQRVLAVFHYALQPGGLLFLGSSENLGQEHIHFSALDRHWRIYRRDQERARPLSVNQVPVNHLPAHQSRSPSLPPRPPQGTQRTVQQIQRLLLEEYAPPAAVINTQGDLVFINGRTGRYLELPSDVQQPNNVLTMVPDGLRYELAAAIQQVQREQRELTIRHLSIEASAPSMVLDLVLRPLTNIEQNLVLIIFREQPNTSLKEPPVAEQIDQVAVLRRELRQNREALQVTVEQMLLSTEELRATNEEHQTSIEELKSTNEELMTSKEELQSLNEELITTNSEHQRIILNLGQANDDMKNLLESAGIATLFLDNNLIIKRFTPRITSVIRLLASDIGRPISDFSAKLQYPNFRQDLERVGQTLSPLEVQVQTQDQHWYLMRVSPYRTSDNFIDGVVVTFTNIDIIKDLEGQLGTSLLYADALLEKMLDAMVVFDQELRLITANQPFYQLLHTSFLRAQGEQLVRVGNESLRVLDLPQRLEEMIQTQRPLENYLIDIAESGRGIQKYKIEAWPVRGATGEHTVYFMALENITSVVQRVAEVGEATVGDTQDDPD